LAEVSKRGKSPSFLFSFPSPLKERDSRGESKRGEASLIYPFPPPFEGEGV
jgi:hypothetical protein